MLNKEEAVKLFGEFIVYKAKTFSQNAVIDKKKNYFLLKQAYFPNFRSIAKFMSEIKKNGVISIGNFKCVMVFLEYCLQKDGMFDPMMSDSAILDYFFSLTKTHKSSSIAQYRLCINIFFQFLLSRGIQAKNLKDIHMNFLKQKPLPSFLNEQQYQEFLKIAKTLKEDTYCLARKKLAILLVAYTGIRTRELSHIQLKDISNNTEQYSIKIQGKCGRDRIVSLKKELIETTFAHFIQLRNLKQIQSDFLFQTKNINTPQYFPIDLKPILKQIDSIQHKGNYLHLLRHSFASFVYRKSKDIVLTQQILGHASINNTQIYVHINQEAHNKVASFF